MLILGNIFSKKKCSSESKQAGAKISSIKESVLHAFRVSPVLQVSVNDKVWGMVEGEKNIKLAMSKVAVLALDGLKKDMKPREESEASKP